MTMLNLFLVGYQSQIHRTRKFGGCCQSRLEAADICSNLRLSFQRIGTAYIKLHHIEEYLRATQND